MLKRTGELDNNEDIESGLVAYGSTTTSEQVEFDRMLQPFPLFNPLPTLKQ